MPEGVVISGDKCWCDLHLMKAELKCLWDWAQLRIIKDFLFPTENKGDFESKYVNTGRTLSIFKKCNKTYAFNIYLYKALESNLKVHCEPCNP